MEFVQFKPNVYPKDKPWFDDLCSRAFDLKQEAHLRWTRDRSRVNWEEFVRCQVRGSETYSETKHQFSVRNIDVLMNVQSPHQWWSLPLLPRGGVYHPNQTLNTESYIAGESYTGLCLAILQ